MVRLSEEYLSNGDLNNGNRPLLTTTSTVMAPKNNDKKKGKLSRYIYLIVDLSLDRLRSFKSHYT